MTTQTKARFLIERSEQVASLLEALHAGPWPAEPAGEAEVLDGYLDTPDWRLFRGGWTFRWRDEAGRKKLTLKSFPVPGASADPSPQTQEVDQHVAAFPVPCDAMPPGPVADQLAGEAGVAADALREVFRIHHYRRRFVLRPSPGTRIEAAIDEATITASLTGESAASGVSRASGASGSPGHLEFRELELELKEGPPEALDAWIESIQRSIDLVPARMSDFERGLQTLSSAPRRGTSPCVAVAAAAPPRRGLAITTAAASADPPCPAAPAGGALTPADGAIDLAYRSLRSSFEDLLAEESKAWEGLSPQGVHQMRVATRRIRAVCRAFASVLPGRQFKVFSDHFSWLAGVLGEVRDLDVYQDNLQHYASDIPAADAAHLSEYQAFLRRRRHAARQRLLRCLAGRRYRGLKDRFARALQRGPSRSQRQAAAAATIAQAARQCIGKQLKRVRRDGRAIAADSPETALHDLRIQCKRLRYLFEFFQPIYGKPLEPTIKRLKSLQELLGEYQDAHVATRQLRQFADRVPARAGHRGLLLSLGQLISGQRRQADSRRRKFDKVWKRFDRGLHKKALLAKLGAKPAALPPKRRPAATRKRQVI